MSTQKTGAPVVGFNHNLMHGGKVFHVQTEDSGLPHAHYITHLFIGGNIVASMKTSYAEQIESPDLPQVVRKLMEGQHKAMVKRLVAGEFKETAEKFQAAHYAPGVLASGQTGPAAVNVAPTDPAAASAMTARPAAASPAVKAHPPTVKTAPLAPAPSAPAKAQPAAAKPPPAAAPPPAHPPAAPPGAPARPAPLRPLGPAPGAAPKPPPHLAPPPPQPLWQASPPTASGVQMAPPGASQPPPARQPGQALPSTTRVAPVAGRPAVAPPKLAPVIPPAAHVSPTPTPGSGHSPVLSSPLTPVGLPAVMAPPATPAPPVKAGLQPQLHAAKPVNIFADETAPVEKPTDDLPTLFAEELISEKSLDEVILAFLSADLEPPK